MAKPEKASDVDPRELEGRKAPDLTLEAVGEHAPKVKISDFAGDKVVVLYFYPKDDTPGCTTEACGFRDMSREYRQAGAVVLGVSPDTVASHEKFASKYKLPFTLLADPDCKAAVKYGVWKQKTRFGKTSLGINRSTFVIGKDGKVAKVYKTVKPDGHNDQVLKFITEKLS